MNREDRELCRHEPSIQRSRVDQARESARRPAHPFVSRGVRIERRSTSKLPSKRQKPICSTLRYPQSYPRDRLPSAPSPSSKEQNRHASWALRRRGWPGPLPRRFSRTCSGATTTVFQREVLRRSPSICGRRAPSALRRRRSAGSRPDRRLRPSKAVDSKTSTKVVYRRIWTDEPDVEARGYRARHVGSETTRHRSRHVIDSTFAHSARHGQPHTLGVDGVLHSARRCCTALADRAT